MVLLDNFLDPANSWRRHQTLDHLQPELGRNLDDGADMHNSWSVAAPYEHIVASQQSVRQRNHSF